MRMHHGAAFEVLAIRFVIRILQEEMRELRDVGKEMLAYLNG